VCLITAVLSGGYPAVLLTRFNTANSLKGAIKSGIHGIWLRNCLTFLQFALAITLVSIMFSVWRQVSFMKDQNLNFDSDNVIVVPLSSSDFSPSDTSSQRVSRFKDTLSKIPGVLQVSASMSVPGNYANSNTFARPEGWNQEQPLRMRIAPVDESYFDTYGIEFIEGENFSESKPAAESSIIINETAMKDMGWETAVGRKVNNWTVVGVAKDFHYDSLQNQIAAVIHLYRTADNDRHRNLSIKLTSDDVGGTLEAIKEQWQVLDSSRPFEYYFVDENFSRLYKSTEDMTRLVGYFSFLSILIANLGLLGLVSYTVIQKTKEVGVRKVFGATTTSIALFLVKGFIRPVILANLIAWPVAYAVVNTWLENFAYRIEINPLTFIAGGLFILTTALLTALTQSAKAVTLNPVKALRYE
jgi:putative ABC transport system permease protein